jgi:hypothetical protein
MEKKIIHFLLNQREVLHHLRIIVSGVVGYLMIVIVMKMMMMMMVMIVKQFVM